MYPIGAVDALSNRLVLSAVLAAAAGQGYLATVNGQEADAMAGVSFQVNSSVVNPGANAILFFLSNTESTGGDTLVISKTRILAGVADTVFWEVDVAGTAAGGATLTPVNHQAGGSTFATQVAGAEQVLSGSTAITGLTAAASKAAGVAYVAAATPAAIDEVIVLPPGHTVALVCLAGGTETFAYSFTISVRSTAA